MSRWGVDCFYFHLCPCLIKPILRTKSSKGIVSVCSIAIIRSVTTIKGNASMLSRVIDPSANDVAIERIRSTFDELVGTMDISHEASNAGKARYLEHLPEDLVKPSILKPAEGDLVYGLTEDGVEAVAVYHAMGWVIFARDGNTIVPEGVDGPDSLDDLPLEERYDTWYAMLTEFVRAIDMPDKILEPLDDEIDVEAGFGDADLDGEPLDPNDE